MFSMLSNIRLGLCHRKLFITTKVSDLNFNILNVMWDEKLINGFYKKENIFVILLKYDI